MQRRDFIKTAAIVPLINWDMGLTTSTHRPTDLEKAIAAYHWPFAKKGLGAELMRLTRNLMSRHKYEIDSIAVHRVDEKGYPGAFTLWCNMVESYSWDMHKKAWAYNLQTKKQESWTKEIVEDLHKENFIRSGLKRDNIQVWLTTMPNYANCYCPIFQQDGNGWSYNTINWSSVKIGGLVKQQDFVRNYYKWGFPIRRKT